MNCFRINLPVWNFPAETGYEEKTTFWQDFSIADAFGINAIKDTFNRAFKFWKTDIEYLTELSLVLNHKAWQWNDKDGSNAQAYVKLYSDLFHQVDYYAKSNLKDAELQYYLKTTD